MLGSFLFSLKKKSGADKRQGANLPTVRLQGQVRDKTGLPIRQETPAAELPALRGKILGPDIKREKAALELRGQGSQEINYTDALIHPSSTHVDFLLAFVGFLGWKPKQAVVKDCVSTARVK